MEPPDFRGRFANQPDDSGSASMKSFDHDLLALLTQVPNSPSPSTPSPASEALCGLTADPARQHHFDR